MSLTNGSVELEKLSQAPIGKIISFVYYGHGQNYGKVRKATVVEVLTDGILAQEINETHPKHFKDEEAYEVQTEPVTQMDTDSSKTISFVDAREMLSEAGWANEPTLDILTGEQLTVLFGAFHTARENAEFGQFEYEWDTENGNVVITDNVSQEPFEWKPKASSDGLYRSVDITLGKTQDGSSIDFRFVTDQLGNASVEHNGSPVRPLEFLGILANFLE